MTDMTIMAILLLVMCGAFLWAIIAVKCHRDKAVMLLRWVNSMTDTITEYQHRLERAERDMATMIDCCDICGHNNNPNCPADECDKCGMDCACRECRNSSNFVWRGYHETERRSGVYDTGGETEKGGGDRKGPTETVSSALEGS